MNTSQSHDIKLFLSAVTDEFEPKDQSVAYRSRLRRICDGPNVTVKIQEDFIAGGVPTLDKLDDYIRSCDVVIHLVGYIWPITSNCTPQSNCRVLMMWLQAEPVDSVNHAGPYRRR